MTTVPAPPMQTTIRVAPPAATPGGSGVIVSPPPLVQGPAPVPPVTLPQPMPPQMPPGYPYPGGYGYPDPYYGGNPYGGYPYGGMPYGGNPYGGYPYGGSPYGYDPYGYGYGGYYAQQPMPPSGYGNYMTGSFFGIPFRLGANGPPDVELSPDEEFAIRQFYEAMRKK